MPLCLQKEAERFRRLLQNAEVVQELDRASGSKARGSKQLTWDAVFRYFCISAQTAFSFNFDHCNTSVFAGHCQL